MDILYSGFRWFLSSTLGASVVALLVLAVMGVFRYRMSVRVRHVLWLIVLVRLLIPVFPSSPVSVLQVTQLDFSQLLSLIHPFQESGTARQGAQSILDTEEAIQGFDSGQIGASGPGEEALQPVQSPASSAQEPGFMFKMFALLWFAGVVALLSVMAVHMLKMSRSFKTLQPVTDSRILDVLEDCQRKLRINKRVAVYTGGKTASGPHIYGLLRPRIFIPEALCRELSSVQLGHILLHELAHFKRKDTLWSLLGGIALALHWMNPLVWLCMKTMKTDRELACDACALDVLGEAEALPYGMTIIEVLKSYASRRSQPQALGFYGADSHNQLMRRIRMIKAFKKGSYKLTAVSILCVIAISAASLTNAADPSGESQTGGSFYTIPAAEETILFEPANGSRTYDNLDKAVRTADFAFKVPYALPADYKLEEARLRRTAAGGVKLYAVDLNFRRIVDQVSTGQFKLSAVYGGEGVEQAYENIEKQESIFAGDLKQQLNIQREQVNIQGKDVLKVHVSRGKYQRIHYIWQDEGVQYQIGPFSPADPDTESLISSMNIPVAPMDERYVSESLFNVNIYDTGDLQRGGHIIGFTPKFPLEVLNQFRATGAMVTRKSNFGFPENKADRDSRLLWISFAKSGEDGGADEGVQSFTLQQIQNNGIFEEIQSSGQAAFQQIDGQKFTAAVSPLKLEGQEVYRTGKYKIDGVLSSPEEQDFVSYFWKEGDVCFQVRFTGDGGRQMDEIVSALIREKPVDLKQFKLE